MGAAPESGLPRRTRPTRLGPAAGVEFVEGWGMSHGARSRVWRPRAAEEVAQVFDQARARGVSVGLRGAGCSYGDASVNGAGDVLDVTRMNRVLSFDEETGVADCEAGVTIRDLWRHSLPRGYWPKVVSGTMFPTLAGAAGMNIHGKNNYKVGTIGDAIQDVDLVLPSGEQVRASRDERPELFHAAIGGFGMLGAITRVRIATKRIHSGDIDVAGVSVPNIGAMMDYVDAHTDTADYLVGWVDCFGRGDAAGRGLIHHARYLDPGEDPQAEKTLTMAHQELPGMIMGVFPKGEVWRLEEHLAELVEVAGQLANPAALVVLSTYAVGHSPLALQNLFGDLDGGSVQAGELAIPEAPAGEGAPRRLPAGFCARWARGCAHDREA